MPNKMKDLELMADDVVRHSQKEHLIAIHKDVEKTLKELIAKALLEVRKDAYRECAEIAFDFDCDAHDSRTHDYDCCGHKCNGEIKDVILAKMEELK